MGQYFEEYLEERQKLYRKRAAVQAYLETLDYAISHHNHWLQERNLSAGSEFRKIEDELFEKYFGMAVDLEV